MTEAEIMKALECCSKVVEETCAECPLCGKDCFKLNLEKFALDLINLKNAEIDRLEALSKHHQTLINMLNEGIAEAIKEVLGKAKKRLRCGETILDKSIQDILDQIAKEMGVR